MISSPDFSTQSIHGVYSSLTDGITPSYKNSSKNKSDDSFSIVSDINDCECEKSQRSWSSIECLCLTPTKNINYSKKIKELYGELSPEVDIMNDFVMDYLTVFNSRFRTNCFSLDDVTGYVDSLHRKLRKSKGRENTNVRHNIILHEEHKGRASELNELKLQNADMKTRIASLEREIMSFNVKYRTLNDSNGYLTQNVSSLQNSIETMREIVDDQLNDLITLGKQRDDLIAIVDKQSAVIHNLELLSKPPQVTINRIEKSHDLKSNKKSLDSSDELYTCLCSFVKLLSEAIPSMEGRIYEIKENHGIPPRERILLMGKLVIDENKKLIEENNKLRSDNIELTNKRDYYQNKCIEILSMFEEQHRFLSNLTHSNDLQNAIFYQEKRGTSIRLNQEYKDELIRQCAKFGQYVEETIGCLNVEKFNEIVRNTDLFNVDLIYELLHPQNFVDKLNRILQMVGEPSEINNRELFDLFTAQVFMNSILKNYVMELKLYVDTNRFRTQQYNADVMGALPTDSLQVEIQTLKQDENDTRDFLRKFVELDEQLPTSKLVKKFIKSLRKSIKQMSIESEEATKQLSDELVIKTNEVQTYLNELEKLQKNLDEVKEQRIKLAVLLKKEKSMTQNLQDRAQSAEKERDEYRRSAESLQLKVDSITHEFDIARKKLESVNTQANNNELEELRKKASEYEEKCKVLSARVEECDEILTNIKQQRNQLGLQFEAMKLENNNVKNKLQEQIEEHKLELTKLEEEMKRRAGESETKLLKQVEEKTSELVVLNTKYGELSTEFARLSVEKKTLETKIKSLEQRSNIQNQNMKSKISAQMAAQNLEHSAKSSEFNQIIKTAYEKLVPLISGDNIPKSLVEVADLLVMEVEKLRHVQLLYVEVLDELHECQKVLEIDNQCKIFDAIKLLASKKDGVKENDQNVEKKILKYQNEISHLSKEIKKLSNYNVSLKQWQFWAHRLRCVIYETDSTGDTDSKLRESLEQAILASVRHRSIFYRIDLLRLQKSILVKYDRSIIINRAVIPISFRALMIVCFANRRIQKIAGCLPICYYETDKLTKLPRVRNNN